MIVFALVLIIGVVVVVFTIMGEGNYISMQECKDRGGFVCDIGYCESSNSMSLIKEDATIKICCKEECK